MSARTLYQQYRQRIPGHAMHVYARFMVTAYLTQRYGAARVRIHAARLARALANTDGSIER